MGTKNSKIDAYPQTKTNSKNSKSQYNRAHKKYIKENCENYSWSHYSGPLDTLLLSTPRFVSTIQKWHFEF